MIKFISKLFYRPWMDYYPSEKKILETAIVKTWGRKALEDKSVRYKIHKSAKACAKNRYRKELSDVKS